MKYSRYREYKNSGVEWLGDVPSDWEVRRLGSMFRQAIDEGDSDLPILSVSIHHGVSDREFDDEELDRKVTRSEDRSKYRRVQTGDLVYNMMRAWQGGFGAVSVDGMVSPAYVVARPIGEFSTPYVERLLRTPQAIEQMRRYSQGVTDFRLRLYWDEFKAIRIPLPPPDEQKAISSFLDVETSKIDGLVSEQRRLIELLKEKRHAVTKGLNPNAPMKPSGIQWPSEVPETWEVVQLRRKFELQRGVDITKDEQIEGDVPVVSSGGISSYHNEAIVKGPGVVLGRKGSVGSVHYIEQDYWPHDTTLFVKEFRGNVPRFVYYKVCSMDLASYDTGSSNPTLNRNILHPVKVPWPPLAEQDEIASQLDKVFGEFDSLEAEAERAIELLQERRTALISAGVTGKIDVRQFADQETP